MISCASNTLEASGPVHVGRSKEPHGAGCGSTNHLRDVIAGHVRTVDSTRLGGAVGLETARVLDTLGSDL